MSTNLSDTAQEQSKKIPPLEDRLDRLEKLIDGIKDNFMKANETLKKVTKPFPKFDNISKVIGEYGISGD